MHSEVRTRLRRGAAAPRLPRWLALLFPCSVVGSVLGQSVLTPPPGFQGAPIVPPMGNISGTAGQPDAKAKGLANGPPATPTTGEANAPTGDQMNAQGTASANGQTEAESSGTTKPAGPAPLAGLMQWGALHLHASASYQFLYDTGIHSQPGKTTDTFTHTITPSVAVSVGPHLNFTYSPSFRFFSQRDFHNTIDHFVSLGAGVGVGDWNFSVFQSFTMTDQPLVETGSQTGQKDYSATLSAAYQFNDKLSFNTSGSLGLLFVDGVTNAPVNTNVFIPPQITGSKNYSGSESMNYQFDEKFSAGLGVTVGYSEQSTGFRSVNEEYYGHALWLPGRKLSISVNGGLQDEQFLNKGAPDEITPIFSASVGYQLFEHTALNLSAGRSVTASIFQAQITETTQVGIGLQQRLLGKLQLSLGFGYGTTDYKVTTSKLATSRSDEGTSYSAGLSLPFLRHGNVGTFYTYSKNSSSAGGFGYSSSQAGASVSWAY